MLTPRYFISAEDKFRPSFLNGFCNLPILEPKQMAYDFRKLTLQPEAKAKISNFIKSRSN